MANIILTFFFLALPIAICGNEAFPVQLKTEQNKASSLCQMTDKLPHFFTIDLNVRNILKYIFVDRAPADVNNKEIFFCTSESMWSLYVWDNLHVQFYVYHDKPLRLSIPFKRNISSISENIAIELFDSPKLTYRKISPTIACIDFYNSTEKWYLVFKNERQGYYITYEMKYNDPLSGIHEFTGGGTFSIKNTSIQPNE